MSANPARGEAAFVVDGKAIVLRPTFEALIAAEAELGPLFALVERAAAGDLKLAEMTALFWHCCEPLAEEREAYRLEIVGNAFERAVELGSTQYLYTLAEQLADDASGAVEVRVVQLGTHGPSRTTALTFEI